jgi:hypothetical protein
VHWRLSAVTLRNTSAIGWSGNLEQAANVEHILSSKTGVKKTLFLNDLAESVYVPD